MYRIKWRLGADWVGRPLERNLVVVGMEVEECLPYTKYFIALPISAQWKLSTFSSLRTKLELQASEEFCLRYVELTEQKMSHWDTLTNTLGVNKRAEEAPKAWVGPDSFPLSPDCVVVESRGWGEERHQPGVMNQWNNPRPWRWTVHISPLCPTTFQMCGLKQVTSYF